MSSLRSCNIIFKPERIISTKRHPLHLRCDCVKWNTVFERLDSPCIVAISHGNKRFAHGEKLFVTMHLENIPNDNEKDLSNFSPIPMTITSSYEFHSHYNIDMTSQNYFMTLIKPMPIKSIVFGATSDDTLEWARKQGFESGLVVSGTCCKSLLIRQGDQFLASLHNMFGEDKKKVLQHFQNLITIDCAPLKQGTLNINTSITVIRIKPKKAENKGRENLGIDSTLSVLKVINIHELTENILSTEYDELSNVIISKRALENNGFENEQLCKLIVKIKNEATTQPKQTEKEYLSMNMNADQEQYSNCRVVKVTTLNKNVETKLVDDSVYISAAMMLNILPNTKIGMNVDCKVAAFNAELQFALEIHLALVLSPCYSPGSHFDKCLIKYLKNTRILSLGDVIAISVENDPDFFTECDSKSTTSCKGIYYKVLAFGEKEKKDDVVCCKVNIKHTNLYQDGSVNSYIPLYKMIGDLHGLQKYYFQLKNIVQPYVTNKMNSVTPTILLSGVASCGKKSLVKHLQFSLNLHLYQINCYELLSDSSGAMEGKISTAFQRAILYIPCIILLNGIECIGWDKDGDQSDPRVCSAFAKAVQDLQIKDKMIAIVIGVTTNKMRVVASLRSFFMHHVEVNSPNENERLDMLDFMTKKVCGYDINLKKICKQSTGFVYGDFWEIVRKSTQFATERLISECSIGTKLSWDDEEYVCASGVSIRQDDLLKAVDNIQREKASSAGMPKVPNVNWSDIGGLEEVKKHIKDTIELPLNHPELAATGLCRSGILLYGPPGTGKTLLAKAVASQCLLNFLSVKGPELINMYVGQSEQNVRQVFAKARDAAPCVIFFDELDSLAPNRGRSGDSGGVMDRVVSQLLAELDGMQGETDMDKHVFAIAASNRPDLVDPALLRPGRFDKLIYVGVNKNKTDNLKVLQAQTKNINLAHDVNLHEIVNACADNMTGADFYALTSKAVMNAIRERINYEEKHCQISKDKLQVEHAHFMNAVLSVIPSLSKSELARYENIDNTLQS